MRGNPDAIDNFLKNTSPSKNWFYAWIENNPYKAVMAVVIIVGFFVRLYAALNADGIYHPDEIFQGYEMAHLLTYDSGRKPAEFSIGNDTPSYDASRSWVFPLMLSFIMRLGEFLNLDYHTEILPLIRIVTAFNATLLIPAAAKLTKQITKDQNSALVVALVISLYWRIIEVTVRPMTNTFFLPMLFYGIYRVLISLEKEKISKYDHLIVILCLGLPTYVRLDLSITVFAFFLVTFNWKRLTHYTELIIDGIIGWLLCALVDYHYYDKIFSVPINWFKFNIIEHNSDWFGLQPYTYYYDELIYYDNLTMWSMLMVLFVVALVFLREKDFDKGFLNEIKLIENGYIRLVSSTIIIWAIFSSFWRNMSFKTIWHFVITQEGWDPQSHKEIRFIMAGLVVLLITISVFIVLFSKVLSRLVLHQLQKYKKIKISNPIEARYWSNLITVLLILLIFIIQSFSTGDSRYHQEQFDDVNEALMYVGSQDNVTGVIVISQWFLIGSYTYLHLGPEVKINTTNLATNNLQELERNKRRTKDWISSLDMANYLILPRFQTYHASEIYNWLRNNNWDIDAVIDGRCEVWKRNG
jgi:hypothetical protein